MTQAPTYEASVKRLEAIVTALSTDVQPLADALALVDEGLGCLRDASNELATVETKLKLLLDGTDGVVVVRDLDQDT